MVPSNAGIADEAGELDRVHIFIMDRRHHRGDQVRGQLQEGGGAHGLGPVPLELGHGLLDVQHGPIHVHRVLKGQVDHGHVLRGDGRYLLQIVQCRQGLLQGLRDGGLHLLRGCAHVGGDEDDVGEAHLRQQVGGHAGHRDRAQDQHQYDGNQNGEGLFYAVFGDHILLRNI